MASEPTNEERDEEAFDARTLEALATPSIVPPEAPEDDGEDEDEESVLNLGALISHPPEAAERDVREDTSAANGAEPEAAAGREAPSESPEASSQEAPEQAPKVPAPQTSKPASAAAAPPEPARGAGRLGWAVVGGTLLVGLGWWLSRGEPSAARTQLQPSARAEQAPAGSPLPAPSTTPEAPRAPSAAPPAAEEAPPPRQQAAVDHGTLPSAGSEGEAGDQTPPPAPRAEQAPTTSPRSGTVKRSNGNAPPRRARSPRPRRDEAPAEAASAPRPEEADERAEATKPPAKQEEASVEDLLNRALGGQRPEERPASSPSEGTNRTDETENLPEKPNQLTVRRSLAGLMPLIRRCAEGESGIAMATIEVSNDGKVQHVSVSGSPFGGTPKAQCMEEVIRTRARFPRFRSPTFRIRYPFAVRPPAP